MAHKRTNQSRSVLAVVPVIMAIVYGVSPVDLIPDILPLIGWVDDGIMGMLMSTISIWMLLRSRKQRLNDSVTAQ